jgi:osmotically-inducible protein OsmY
MLRCCGVVLLAGALSASLSGCGAVIVGGTATAASVVHDRRTAGTVVEDQAIELKAYEALDREPQRMADAHVSVTSYNNVVLLSGEVPDLQTRQWIEEQVRQVEKVRKVHNELVVAPPSSLANRSNDAWITTKVKTSLIQISGLPDFDPTRVKVVTERGSVYLMGLVSQAEGEASASVARQVSGVQRVIKLFEYL